MILEVLTTQTELDRARIAIPEWNLSRIAFESVELPSRYAGTTNTSSTFVLTMDVQRQSIFMLRLIVFPLVLIVILSWSVFWMDRSSLGDRVNVSFIGILTAVAYQFMVSEILPQISYVTWMTGFLNISFWIMCATVVVNLVVGAADKNGNFVRGDLIDRRCRWIFPTVYFGLLSLTFLIATFYS